MRRIGVLTGGGDTSSLNATLKGVALEAERQGFELLGFVEGWKGLYEGRYVKLRSDVIDERAGGTLLKTSRTDLRKVEGGFERSVENLKKLGVEALIAVGGDDTLTVGAAFAREFATAFVTKTIDNDVGRNPPEGGRFDFEGMINYFCPGFPTAAMRFASFVRDLRTTAYSHERVIVVEAMGRDMGWLALAGACGGADIVVIPEVGLNYERLKELVAEKFGKQRHLIIAVAEGIKDEEGRLLIQNPDYIDAFGHAQPGGCSELIAKRLKNDLSKKLGTTNFNHVIPSYLQRCGPPTEIDMRVSMELGRKAVEALKECKVNHVACTMRRGDEIVAELLPMDEVLQRDETGKVIPRGVDPRLYEPEAMNATAEGIEYFRPILGEMPRPFEYPKLEIQRV